MIAVDYIFQNHAGLKLLSLSLNIANETVINRHQTTKLTIVSEKL